MSHTQLILRSRLFVARMLALLMLTTAAVSVQAAPIIFSQPADNTGSADASQRSPNQNPDLFAVSADDFTLCLVNCSSFTITDVHWTGEFFNPAVESTPTDFEITFYQDNAGTPGAQIAFFNGFGAAGKSATCPPVSGFPRCTYDVNLPGAGLSLTGGTYWMSVVADLPAAPPQWGWATAGSGNGVQSFLGSPFAPTGHAYAFDLTGTTDAAAVPEPTTLTLLGAGLAGLFARRRKRR